MRDSLIAALNPVRLVHTMLATSAFLLCRLTLMEALLLDIILDLSSRWIVNMWTSKKENDPTLFRKRQNKFVRLRDPSFHLDRIVPFIRFGLLYTSNIKSIEDLLHHPAIFEQLKTKAIDPAMQKSLPIRHTCVAGPDDECMICWDDEIHSGSEWSRLPCGHIYHSNCISQWFDFRSTCPLCRHIPPSINEIYAIESVNTSLMPQEGRLSRGEMLVLLKPKGSQSTMTEFPVRCWVLDDDKMLEIQYSASACIIPWVKGYIVHALTIAILFLFVKCWTCTATM